MHIFSDDIELCYDLLGTAVGTVFHSKTLGDLWLYSTTENHVGQLVGTNHVTTSRLALKAEITLNQEVIMRQICLLACINHVLASRQHPCC